MKSSVRRGKLLRSSALVALLVTGAANAANAADPTYQFNIPAESLSQALTDFSQASSQQIIYTEDLVRGRKSAGLHGTFTAGQALETLLAGTGLKVQVNAAGVMMVQSKNVQAASTEAAPSGDIETVTVTGTLIPGTTPASAVITLGQVDIQRSGYQTTRDILINLPQSSGGGDNPTTAAVGGTHNVESATSASSADLRGLGSESTLMLVDGHRLSYDGSAGSSDASLIPIGAIQRVEILTDGASALYGSDAVSGVVNFILRKDFDGLTTTADIGGATQGGAFEQEYSILGGKTWDSGNVVGSYEHFDQDGLYASQRSFTHDAVAPTTLTPPTHRDSFFLAGNQDITSSLTAFFEGLYTDRHATLLASYDFGGLFTLSEPNSVHEYSLVGGLKASLGTWRGTLTGELARDTDNQPNLSVFGGTPLPTVIETFADGLSSVDAIFEGPLLELPGGTVDVALGGGYRHESFAFAEPGSQPSIRASRQVSYGFAETHIPLISPSPERVGLEALDLSASLRYEDYSDFGSTTNPKIGLRWTITSDFSLRGTWGTSYHAPSLYQEYNPTQAFLIDIPDPQAAGGISPVLYEGGGNPNLQPETARSWTAGADYTPDWLSGLKVQATYFSIQYSNRITTPISNLNSALTDPIYAPFITRNPSAALQAQTISNAYSFMNYTGSSYDPSTVAALVDGAYANAARETAQGFDLLANYDFAALGGDLNLSGNVTYLDSQIELTPGGEFAQESGTLFNPSLWRGRLGASWTAGEWNLSAFFNFQSAESDPNSTPATKVASFQTVDAQVAYTPDWVGGLHLSLSVRNLFDQDPPYVSDLSTSVSGIHYDGVNASPLGRFISFKVSKDW